MTKTLSINDVQSALPGLLANAREGDEIFIEMDGVKIGKVSPLEKLQHPKPRVLGRGRGEGYYMSDDFDDELPDEFWGFDDEL